jgi:hypothetical protein
VSVGNGRGVQVDVIGGDSVVAVGGAVVFVGRVVFVGVNAGCCVFLIVGLGVRDGALTVENGSVG